MSRAHWTTIAALGAVSAGCVGGAAPPPSPGEAAPAGAPRADAPPTQCPGYNPYKYAYFGNLHQHTERSLDAYTFGTRTMPAAAYLFAKMQGGSITVGAGTSDPAGPKISATRALDFLAITDHSEWLTMTQGCVFDASSPYYNDPNAGSYEANCHVIRSTDSAFQGAVWGSHDDLVTDTCDELYPGACTLQAENAWSAIIAEAATAYAPCSFTSLVAYEWSGVNGPTGGLTNHRNVIFATDTATSLPATALGAYNQPTPPALWTALDTFCTNAGIGCSAVTIPHNTNLSGQESLLEFQPSPTYPNVIAQQTSYQVSAEIYQHKGSSECYYNPAQGYPDPECKFEQYSSVANDGPLNYVRGGLEAGIVQAASTPMRWNQLQLGIVGAVDDHNAAPGYVDEAIYVGHLGRLDDQPALRLYNRPEDGSGGLTGAWAEQNTRDRIFAAIQRRETFATSGPRIQVRFYQTTVANPCSDPAFPKQIVDAGGIPMGGTFGAAAIGTGQPVFAIQAWPDAYPQIYPLNGQETPGAVPLAQVEVIKAHALANGSTVTMTEDPPYLVSGNLGGGGCTTWTDTGYNPNEFAFYYVRVRQQPTYRWSHFDCKVVNPKPPACATLPDTIQERAWTSPIWAVPFPGVF